jgi:hypothetical protein
MIRMIFLEYKDKIKGRKTLIYNTLQAVSKLSLKKDHIIDLSKINLGIKTSINYKHFSN